MSDQGAGNIPVTGDEHVLLQNDEGAWIGEATTQQIADLGGGGLLVATATLNGAALATLFSAPTQIVAAPGAGTALVVIGGWVEFKPGAVGYSVDSGGPAIYYGSPLVANQASADLQGIPGFTANQPVHDIAVGLQPSADPFGAVGPAGIAVVVPVSVASNAALVVGADTADPDIFGPIASATIAAGGAGYAINDTGTVGSSDYGAAATYIVTAVGGGGAVTAFTITAPGDGYGNGDNPHSTATDGAQPGVGTGFQVNTTPPPADGDLYVTVLYRVLALH